MSEEKTYTKLEMVELIKKKIEEELPKFLSDYNTDDGRKDAFISINAYWDLIDSLKYRSLV